MIHLQSPQPGEETEARPKAEGIESEPLTPVHGEPSYTLANEDIDLKLTRRGGHIGPVRFKVGRKWVQPYALAPWKPDEIEGPPIIRVLRGDYFCFPFGSSKGVKDVHGETANEAWEPVEDSPGKLVMEMDVGAPACRVQKTIAIREGQRAIYQEHLIEGLAGKYNFGHHSIIQFPLDGGDYHVNVSPFKYGRVKPDAFSDPLNREYGALKTGATFKDLGKVPLATGGTTSLQDYPARRGFEDLILVASKPGDFAWSAATLDGYVWIQLKDPRTLPSTLFWISNGGRHGEPWNGRHLGRLGIEEVCGHYSDGLEISRQDKLKKAGVPTTLDFKAKRPTAIRLIHAVHPVAKGFGMVKSIERDKSGKSVTVKGASGKSVVVPVEWKFLHA